MRKILGAEDIRRLLETHAPKQRWLHIQELHDLLEPHFRGAAPGLAAADPAEFDARRMHDLRNLLQKDKKGRLRWDEAAHAYFIPELDADLEDALLQPEPAARLRSITPEELARAQEALRRVGRRGEELVAAYLARRKAAGSIADFAWVAETSADAPYDFEVRTVDGRTRRVEVKTTEGGFGTRFRVSYAQMVEMAKSGDFEVYRVFDVTPMGATLRASTAVRARARQILDICKGLGEGVRPGTFIVRPAEFDFGPPEALP